MRLWFRTAPSDIPSTIVEEAIQNTHRFVQKIRRSCSTARTSCRASDESRRRPREDSASWIDEGWQKIREYPESHWEKWPKQVYLDRIESEWKILKSKGVIDYFVLVGDVVRWAKAEGDPRRSGPWLRRRLPDLLPRRASWPSTRSPGVCCSSASSIPAQGPARHRPGLPERPPRRGQGVHRRRRSGATVTRARTPRTRR
jgi:hypothetical protein